MCEAPVTEVVLKMHAAAIPPDEAGLIELKTLNDGVGLIDSWQLTPAALLDCRQLEKRLARMVVRIAHEPRVERRYEAALSLLATVALQDDQDGILMALDYAEEALTEAEPQNPLVQRALALGEELDPVTFFDVEAELFERLAYALARLSDPVLIERCLDAAVTRVRSPSFNLEEMPAFLEAARL